MSTNQAPAEAQDVPAWKRAWRLGFRPQFSTDALVQLAAALKSDALKLIQGATCEPVAICSNNSLPVCRACAIGFLAMIEGAHTVAEVEERFADACFRADVLLGEPCACRRFLNWFDDQPRHLVLPELLAEIEANLAAAEQPQPAA
jgi:hypothetical protein